MAGGFALNLGEGQPTSAPRHGSAQSVGQPVRVASASLPNDALLCSAFPSCCRLDRAKVKSLLFACYPRGHTLSHDLFLRANVSTTVEKYHCLQCCKEVWAFNQRDLFQQWVYVEHDDFDDTDENNDEFVLLEQRPRAYRAALTPRLGMSHLSSRSS